MEKKERTYDPSVFWDQGKAFYGRMKRRHAAMFRFLQLFIEEAGCKRMLEVGGATGYMGELTPELYINVERNAVALEEGSVLFGDTITEGIHDDWTKMDTRQFADRNLDLILASSVIEHCSGWGEFIIRCIDANPKFIVITFFRNLNPKKQRLVKVEGLEGSFFENHYSGKAIKRWLRRMALPHHFYTLIGGRGNVKNDVALIIDLQGADKSLWKKLLTFPPVRRGLFRGKTEAEGKIR